MSLSMSNLPKSLLEGPVGRRAVGEPCLRCDLARSTTGRDGLTGARVNCSTVSLESGDDVSGYLGCTVGIHTRPTVAWGRAAGVLQGTHRLSYDPERI